MKMNIYNQLGFPSAFSPDDKHLYDQHYDLTAYIEGNIIYSPTGRFVGSIAGDWLLDAAAAPIYYLESKESEVAKGRRIGELRRTATWRK